MTQATPSALRNAVTVERPLAEWLACTAPPLLRAGVVLAITGIAACRSAPATSAAHEAGDDSAAVGRVTASLLERHTRALSAPSFLGRAPGTRGETLTVAYVERELRRAGLQPGNPDGTYTQPFMLYNPRTRAATGSLTVAGRPIALTYGTDFVAGVTTAQPRATVQDAPVVFVGYGIVAPELGWDDYKDADVRGKIVVFIDPVPLRTAGDTTIPDFTRFGRAYWSRSEVKRQIAASRGAVGTIMIDYDLVRFAAAARRTSVAGTYALADDAVPPLGVGLSRGPAVALLAGGGLDSASAIAAARRRDFRPVPLGLASFDVTSDPRPIPTRNVVAVVPGSDPTRRGEYVIVTAHWDAWGVGPSPTVSTANDPAGINRGAADNAAGTAGLLAVAEALGVMRPRPPRTIVLIATSAEERGYNGARWYARHPLYPLARTVGMVNLDLYGAPLGRSRDVVIWGGGRSTIDALVEDIARAQGRRVGPDPVRSQGLGLRMDHFPFNEVGIPGVSLAPGFDLIDRPSGYAKEKLEAWTATRYHAPGDTVDADWDFAGLALDVRTSLLLALRLAREERWPEWNAGAEFARGRDVRAGTTSR